VGKRTSYIKLEERATGERLGGIERGGGGWRPLGRHRPRRFSTPTMPRPVILPISKISRLFIHIAIFWLAYELNAI